MANEQMNFNARLSLKYDLYSNWSTNNPVLLKGEVAFAYIPEENTVEVEGGNSVVGTKPSRVLMKVGDGVNHYNDLKFTHSLAADVYDWAKAAVKPEYKASEIKELDTYIGEKVQDTNTEYTLVKVNDYQYKIMSKTLGEEEFTTEVGVIDIPAYDDSALSQRVTDNADAIAILNGDAETEGSVVKAIADAITALNLAETYAAKVHTHAIDDVTGLQDALDDKASKDEAQGYASAAEAAANEYTSNVEQQVIAAAAAAEAAAEAAENAYNYATEEHGRISEIEETLIAGTYYKTEDFNTFYNDEFIARVSAVETAQMTFDQTQSAMLTDIETFTDNGVDSGKSIRTIANEELAAQLIGEDAKESLDTLQEIAAWIQSHPDDASAMNDAIIALQNKVDTGDKTVSAYVTDAINALAIGDYAKAADLAALAGRVSKLETASATHALKTEVETVQSNLDEYEASNNAAVALKANSADVYAKTETFNKDEVNEAVASAKTYAEEKASAAQAAAEATAAADATAKANKALEDAKAYAEEKASDAQAAAEATAAADATAKANKALEDANAYSDGLNTAMDTRVAAVEAKVPGYDEAVTKAGTAVQDVVAGAGVSVSRENNVVTVGLDSTVTFIFDCGDSSNI